MSSPPATFVKCWEIQTKNYQWIEQNKQLKSLQVTSLAEAEVSERASAESASAVCSQTLLLFLTKPEQSEGSNLIITVDFPKWLINIHNTASSIHVHAVWI